MRILISLLLLITVSFSVVKAAPLNVASPDGKLKINVKLTDRIYYNLEVDGQEAMWFSPISMKTNQGVLGTNPKLNNSSKSSMDETIDPTWGIRSQIKNQYNELTLTFEKGFSIIFRAYNDGVAYRFKTKLKGELIIFDEEVEYRFLKNHKMINHVVNSYISSYEKLYSRQHISDLSGEENLVSLPSIVDEENLKLAITEADLYEYPGMYLFRKENNNRFYLNGSFAQYPLQWHQGGWCQFSLIIDERAPYIAKTNGNREFPWRVIKVARKDIDLADSDLVYKLSRPSKITADWIEPGRVAWDWWCAWNLSGVDFETGVNNKTYEYYIDFAAQNGIQYVIMDEGWSDQFDVLLPTPMVDMEHITQYATQKGVKLILWCVWHTIDRQYKEAFELFEKWGIAGVKVDFIDRDDQIAIEFYERLAKAAAEHHLLVDYHGCSKPTGLHRTYPNVINFEAVMGNEYNKFSNNVTPQHNIDIVFSRMLVGPIDYTPGAMTNSIEGDFSIRNENPMSYGTRCHQLGMYVVYYAPLQMLCDAPTEYEKYPDILNFISTVPTSWDDTKVIAGEFGEYVVIARRKGNDWYIGGMNDWTEREVEIDLSEFTSGSFQAKILMDGINANRRANDYQFIEKELNSSDKLKMIMKKGGGFAIHLRK